MIMTMFVESLVGLAPRATFVGGLRCPSSPIWTHLSANRSAIVNLDRVKEMHAHFNGEYLVILHDGTELKLSRSRREQLQQILNVGSS